MAQSDPIADFLTVIRNANQARLERVEVAASRSKANIAKILKEEGFIQNFRLVRDGNKNRLRVYMKYQNDGPVITGIQKVSRPGLRRYTKYNEVPKVLGGLGINILTTSKGIMSGKSAQERKVGGEILCKVW